jgi:hypothetical protein
MVVTAANVTRAADLALCSCDHRTGTTNVMDPYRRLDAWARRDQKRLERAQARAGAPLTRRARRALVAIRAFATMLRVVLAALMLIVAIRFFARGWDGAALGAMFLLLAALNVAWLEHWRRPESVRRS